MDAKPALPLDVLELIVAELSSPSSSQQEILADLKAGRLVNRAFAQAFERHLFHSGSFTDLSETDAPGTKKRAETLLDVLTHRPRVANHVRRFTVTIGTSWHTDPSLPLILDRLVALEVLEITGKREGDDRAVKWTSMAAQLRECVTKVVTEREGLRELVFENIWEVPAVLIFGSWRLTKIALHQATVEMGGENVVYSYGDHGSAVGVDQKVASLDLELSLKDFEGMWSCLSGHPNPAAFFGRLRSLTLVPHNESGVVLVGKIWDICGPYGKSLEEVDVRFPWLGVRCALGLFSLGCDTDFMHLSVTSVPLVLPTVKQLPALRKLAVSFAHTIGVYDLKDTFKAVDLTKLRELHVSFVEIFPYDEVTMDVYLFQSAKIFLPLLEGVNSPGHTSAGRSNHGGEGVAEAGKFEKLFLTFEVGKEARREEFPEVVRNGMGFDRLLAREEVCVRVIPMADPEDCFFYHEHDAATWRR